MKKYILNIIAITVLLFAFSGPMFSQSTIKGTVKSGSSGTPVQNAPITIGGDLVGLTDISGNFSFGVASGTNTIAALYDGNTISKTITFAPGNNWMNFWFNPPSLPSDFDGNYYHTVDIGTQTWMVENLLVTHYRDGTSIPNVTDNTAWAGLSTPGYCWYNNDFITYKPIYGALYNWYTVNTGQLCPTGWHVPLEVELNTLNTYLGESDAGSKLKESGTTHWWSPNSGATNETGFTALPGGERHYYAENWAFTNLRYNGYWWSSNEYSTTHGWQLFMGYGQSNVNIGGGTKENGYSVRCIKNMIPAITTSAISSISQNSAQSGGNITSDGGDPVTARGVCWSPSTNPTTANNHTTNGNGTGSFTSLLTGLTANTTYYIRAYATNSLGTSYGDNLSFTTCPNTIATISGSDIVCLNSASPNITFTGANGTAPYTFIYSRNNSYQIVSTSVGNSSVTVAVPTVTAGTFTYRLFSASDVRGSSCSQPQSGSATVTVNPLPAITVITTYICSGAPFSVTPVNITNGIVPPGTTYTWTTPVVTGGMTGGASGAGAVNISGTLNNPTNTAQTATYTVSPTSSSCAGATFTVTVTVNSLPAVDAGPALSAICQGGPTAPLEGSVGGGATGGTWSTLAGGVFTPSTNDLNATWTPSGSFSGTATLTLTTNGGSCGVVSANKTVTVNPNPVAIINGQTNVLCFGDQTGAIDLEMTVGAEPYTYLWSNEKTTQDITNLAAQTYKVTVKDANNCTASATTTITQPATALSLSTSKVDVDCFGNLTGSITVTPSGGTPTYNYLWNTIPAQTTASATNLKAGNYSVTVTDANSCFKTANVVITEPIILTATSTITNVKCNTCNDASINLDVSGGITPYSYSWTGPDGYNKTTEDISSLKPGSYKVVVTDAHGCSKIVYTEVINPFVVTKTSDAGEIGTLRYAINYANGPNAATSNLITFNIPYGLQTLIQPDATLPPIIKPLVIDGFTQPGASLTDLILRVELEGTNAGAGSNGLTINTSNCVVKGLIIDGFSGNGIQVASGTGNTISANSIYNNAKLGIDLGTNSIITPNDAGDSDTGPNNLQNFPVLTSVSFSPGTVTVSGSLNSVTAIKSYRLEFFANKLVEMVVDDKNYSEGQTYLGSGTVTTLSNGNGTFTLTLPTMSKYGDVITATATDPQGNTSEFSQAIGGLQDQILAGINIPFHYSINQDNVETIDYTTIMNAITGAFGNWTGIETSGMSFKYDGKTPTKNASATDKINLISFKDENFPFSPGVLAVTAKTLKVGPDDTDAQIMDADIIFNPFYVKHSTYNFGIADNPMYQGFFDIQSVATHEIGHVLGLLHSGVPNSTMWFEIYKGIENRSLEQDDKSWLSYRYPNKIKYDKAFGSISGNIKYGYSWDDEKDEYTEPVAGAIVLAYDPVTNLPVVHAYSDADGNYKIPGLPPGSYKIRITPLDGDVFGRPLRPNNISPYVYSNTIYTDYPGEFYNDPDRPDEDNLEFTSVSVSAGSNHGDINFITNTDETPPTIGVVTPDDLAEDVDIFLNITITFSEPVDMTTFTDQTCYLIKYGNTAHIGGSYKPIGLGYESDIVLFTPENPLDPESVYNLFITENIEDLKGNNLEEPYSSSFTTRDKDDVLPTILYIKPDVLTKVFLSEQMIISFSESMDKSSVESDIVLTYNNQLNKVDCAFSWSEYTTLILSPKSPLMENTEYTLSWAGNSNDLSGNHLAGGSHKFSTILHADPTIIYAEPGTSLIVDVDVNTSIVVDFSEPINTSTVNAGSFILHEGGISGNKVSGTFEFLNNNSRVVFRPDQALKISPANSLQTYTIELTNQIKDVSPAVGTFAGTTETFTTAKKTTVPHIYYIDPPAGVPGSLVTIGGYGFDPIPSNNKVTFTGISVGIAALVKEASLTSLTVEAPSGAISGVVRVTVNGVADDQTSSSTSTYFYLIPEGLDPCHNATANTSSGSNSRDAALDYDAATAYVTNPGDNTVSVIINLDTSSPEEQFPSIQVGTTPMKIDINPLGTLAYVTNYNSHTVSIIDLATHSVIRTVNVGINPLGIVASPDGEKVYVANYTSENISVINVDPTSGGFDYVVANINTGTGNRDIDITADAGLLVVTGDDGLKIIELLKTDLGFDYVITNVNSGTGTRDVSITADAATAIVTTMEGNILLVDIVPGSENFGAVYANINPPANAGDGKPSFDNAFYYVTNPEDNTITVYKMIYGGTGSNSSTYPGVVLEFVTIVPVGTDPEGLVIDPDNDKIIVVNSGSGTNNGSIDVITICCPESKTASDYIKDLIYPIQEMMRQGDLSNSLGNMLIGKLNDASNNIFRNKTNTAINSMKSFINKVKELKAAGKIYSDDADKLIRIAEYIICLLEQPNGKICSLQPSTAKSGKDESIMSSIDQSQLDLIQESRLGVIYPNPFSQSVTINYEVVVNDNNSTNILIRVYDIGGRLVGTLVDKNMQSGSYSTKWNGTYENGKVAPYGVYFLIFRYGNIEHIKEIMLIR